jgi:hypothetical protein
MKRAYAVPNSLECVVAVKRLSATTTDVAFDFAAPKWDYLRDHLRTTAHPSWFGGPLLFAAIWRGVEAEDTSATGLAECRFSFDRAAVLAKSVECTRVLVRAAEASEAPWVSCLMDASDARGVVWAKAQLRAKLLGSYADFAQRRSATKARVQMSAASSKQGRLVESALVRGVTTRPMIGPLENGCSLFVVSKRVAMEEHPYYGGSGDHVNTGMQADCFFQFAAAVCRSVLGIAADSFVTVASSMEMLRFVEFDVEIALELTGTSSVEVSDRLFADSSAYEVSREWSDVEGELRVVRAQLLQQDRVCARLESVLLPIVKPKL